MTTSRLALDGDPRLLQLSDDVYVFGTYPYSGLIVTDEGCIAVDGPMSVNICAPWKEFIDSKGPLRYQVYCEHHSDHTISAPYLEPEVLISSETTRGVMDTDEMAREALRTWGEYPDVDPAIVENYTMAYPTLTYRGRLNLELGGKRFVLFEAPGHTMGSTVVHAVDDRVAFIADLGMTPAIQSGDPVAWLTTLALLETLDVDWYVQGHMDPMRREDLHTWRTMLLATLDTVRERDGAGLSAQDIIAESPIFDIPAILASHSFVGRADMPTGLLKAAGDTLQVLGAERMVESVHRHPTDSLSASLGPVSTQE